MKSYSSFHALRESTISNRFKIFLENLFCNHILQYSYNCHHIFVFEADERIVNIDQEIRKFRVALNVLC